MDIVIGLLIILLFFGAFLFFVIYFAVKLALRSSKHTDKPLQPVLYKAKSYRFVYFLWSIFIYFFISPTIISLFLFFLMLLRNWHVKKSSISTPSLT